MPVNIGVNIQRSPNRINQQLREAGVEGKFPKLLLDFKDQYYLASGGSKTLANAVTHARSGNAVMTDGYGPELVVNGGFDSDTGFTKGDGWSIRDGHAYCDGSQSATTNLSQTVTIPSAGAYIFEFNVVDVTTSSIGISYTGGGTATVVSAGTYVSRNTKGKLTRVFTFSSGGTFTVVGAAFSTFVGTVDNYTFREMPVLKWAPHNLLRYSEQFDVSTWTKNTGATATANQVVAPDGTTTADEVNFPTAGSSNIQQTVSNLNTTNTYVFAVWLKVASGTMDVRIGNVNSGAYSSVTITDDWQLFTVEQTPSATSRFPRILAASGVTGTFYAWGAHFYRSDLGGMVDNPDQPASRASYVPTTSSAAYLPRIGHHVYNGNSWVNEGLLAESEARTNLLPYSTPDSNWNNSNSTDTANQAIAPDGTETATLVVDNTQNQNHYIESIAVNTAGSGVTGSIYVKKNSIAFARLRLDATTHNSRAWFDIENGTVGSVDPYGVATIQDVGNGWFRCSLSEPNNIVSGNKKLQVFLNTADNQTNYVGDGSGVYIWGAQLEVAATPSSLVPTDAGASVTRAAETFTIPSANLPWPSPQYIGSELVTNGDGSSTANWSASRSNSTLTVTGGRLRATATAAGAYGPVQTLTGLTIGNVYQAKADVFTSGGSGSFYFRVVAASDLNATAPVNEQTSVDKSISVEFVATATTMYVGGIHVASAGGDYIELDNISVREINPLSVSIAMDGRISYTKSGSDAFWRWREDANTYINDVFFTDYKFISAQKDGTTYDQVDTTANYFSGDLLESYDIASRHGSTFINAAESGVALTANTTPTQLPDLSATDLDLAYDYMGTLATFRVWDRDIGDTGLVEATSPSLEPSLSLTFEGVGTNSFVVNDWSE